METVRVPTPLLSLHWDDDPEKAEKLRRRAYRELFGTAAGRLVLADILMVGGFISPDPPLDEKTANHNQGARWLCGLILAAAGVEPAPLARAVILDDLSEALHNDDRDAADRNEFISDDGQ